MPNGAASLGSDYRIDSNRGLPVQIQNQPEVDLLRDQSTSAGEPIDLNNGLSRQEADQFRKVDSNGAVRYEFETETPSTFTIEINGQPISVNYDGRLDAAEIRRLEERALATEIENNPALEGYTIFRREDGTLAAQAPSTVRSVPVSPEQEQAKRQELLEANPGLTNEQINREIDGDGNVILSATLTTPPSAETIQRQIVEFAEANGVDPSQVQEIPQDDGSVVLRTEVSRAASQAEIDAKINELLQANPGLTRDQITATPTEGGGVNLSAVIPGQITGTQGRDSSPIPLEGTLTPQGDGSFLYENDKQDSNDLGNSFSIRPEQLRPGSVSVTDNGMLLISPTVGQREARIDPNLNQGFQGMQYDPATNSFSFVTATTRNGGVQGVRNTVNDPNYVIAIASNDGNHIVEVPKSLLNSQAAQNDTRLIGSLNDLAAMTDEQLAQYGDPATIKAYLATAQEFLKKNARSIELSTDSFKFTEDSREIHENVPPGTEKKETTIPPGAIPIEAIIPPGEEEVPGIVYVGNNQRGDRVAAYAVPFTETQTERNVERFGPRLPDAIKTRYREGAIDLSTALSQVAASSTEELTSAFRAASRPVLTEEVLRKDGSVSSEVTTVGNWQFTPSVELPGNGDQNSFYTSSAIGLGDFRLNTNELYTSEADASAADQQLIEDAVYTEQAVLAFYAMKAEEYGYENLAEGDFALNAADQMELTGILTGQKVDANGQVVRTEQSFTDSEGNVWDLGARGIQWMPNSVPISYASSAAAPESIAQLEAYMNGTEAPAAPSGELTPSIERTPVSEVPVQVNDTQYLLTIDPSETEPGQAAIGVIHQQPLLSDSEQADIAAGGGEGVMSFGELDLETQEAMIQSLLQMAESGQLSLPTWTETSTDNRGNVTTREVEMTPADLEKLLREQMNQSALGSGFFPIHMMHSAA